jgi:hypothetical protein
MGKAAVPGGDQEFEGAGPARGTGPAVPPAGKDRTPKAKPFVSVDNQIVAKQGRFHLKSLGNRKPRRRKLL